MCPRQCSSRTKIKPENLVANPEIRMSCSNNKTSSRPICNGLPIPIAAQPISANSFRPSISVRANRFLTLPHVRASHFNMTVQLVVFLHSYVIQLSALPRDAQLSALPRDAPAAPLPGVLQLVSHPLYQVMRSCHGHPLFTG